MRVAFVYTAKLFQNFDFLSIFFRVIGVNLLDGEVRVIAIVRRNLLGLSPILIVLNKAQREMPYHWGFEIVMRLVDLDLENPPMPTLVLGLILHKGQHNMIPI